MAHVSHVKSSENLPVGKATGMGDSSENPEKSKKGAAALLSTLSDVVKSAEKNTAHKIKDAPTEPSSEESFSDNSDCLMKLTMAGIATTSSKNMEIDATAKAGEQLSEFASKVAKQEAQNINDFYTKGTTSADGIGYLSTDGSGGIGNPKVGSAELPILMNDLQYLQSIASQVNNDMGNVAAIPGTTMQGETQSVTAAQSAASGAGQSQASIASQISSWSSI